MLRAFSSRIGSRMVWAESDSVWPSPGRVWANLGSVWVSPGSVRVQSGFGLSSVRVGFVGAAMCWLFCPGFSVNFLTTEGTESTEENQHLSGTGGTTGTTGVFEGEGRDGEVGEW